MPRKENKKKDTRKDKQKNNNKKSNIMYYVLITILTVALIGGMVFAYFYLENKNKEKEVAYTQLIKDIESRLSDKHLKIDLSEKAKEYILENAYDLEYGARPIKRFINHTVENLIANAIINDEVNPNTKIIIDLENNELVLR